MLIADTNSHGSAAWPQFQDLHLPVDCGQLRYRDVGRGPAVLLLHGWTLDLDMWEPQMAELADAFRLVAMDRRGFGLSTGSPSLSTATDVRDIQALCRHLGLARVAMVGMSQGARVALQFAQIDPEAISALVLDGPPDSRTGIAAVPEDDLPLARYRRLVAEHGVAAFRREWARHPLVQLRTHDRYARELLNRMLARYPGKDLGAPEVVQELSAGPPLVESLSVPTLVLNGELDLQTRRSAANWLVHRLQVAERALIPAAGHLPNLDNPQAYNAILRKFLEQQAHRP